MHLSLWFKSPDSMRAANPQLPSQPTGPAGQRTKYLGYFMVNGKTFVGRGEKREENSNELIGRRKKKVYCPILEYQFFYLKISQKNE